MTPERRSTRQRTMIAECASTRVLRQIRGLKEELIARLGFRKRRKIRVRHLSDLAQSDDSALRQLYRASCIVGVGFGTKLTHGAACGTRGVRVYVTRKRSQAKVSRGARIPKDVAGVPTDVIALGRPRLHIRPVRWGAGVGHERGGKGTLGCVVIDVKTGKRCLLSAAHVFAPKNNNQPGELIVEPPRSTGKGRPIAKLMDFRPLAFDSSSNRFDAAIAELLDSRDVLDVVHGTGPVDPRPLHAAEHQAVAKYGAATEFTRGLVNDLAADLTLEFDEGTLFYDDLIGISGHEGPFSRAGDSGALVVDTQTHRPVGLLVGGTSTTTFVAPIGLILSHFGIQIIAASGD